MVHLFASLAFPTCVILILALIFVLVYEAINGCHDTANAVTIVIYTRALRAQSSVVMSGIFNFLGVLLGGLSVAYTIVHLLPIDLLLNISSIQSLVMVFSMLLTAIFWNLSTWYLGLPVSSSHTLIGTIIGIGLTNALVNHSSVMQALNIPKLIEIMLSLILSPIVELILAATMVIILRYYWQNKKNSHQRQVTPTERKPPKPPFWTRITLILSAAGVSFSHGANDGQKGIGLIMLVLIGISPANFVINMNASSYEISRTREALDNLQQYYTKHQEILSPLRPDKENVSLPLAVCDTHNKNNPLIHNKPNIKIHDYVMLTDQQSPFHCEVSQASLVINNTILLMSHLDNYHQLNHNARINLRRLLICITNTIEQILAKQPQLSVQDKHFLKHIRYNLLSTIEYAPMWIISAVALALSLGTMIGWRRITTTIGENIGKKNMTYVQGLSAQITAAVSIGVASYTGMPVSTTHILSSAVTGTMLINGGGIEYKMVKKIVIAWILTLPVALLLTSCLYWLALKLI